MTNLLDMVKVLSFALKEGKVAVHCHAGLGRTGVLIACYLVYYLRYLNIQSLNFVNQSVNERAYKKVCFPGFFPMMQSDL